MGKFRPPRLSSSAKVRQLINRRARIWTQDPWFQALALHPHLTNYCSTNIDECVEDSFVLNVNCFDIIVKTEKMVNQAILRWGLSVIPLCNFCTLMHIKIKFNYLILITIQRTHGDTYQANPCEASFWDPCSRHGVSFKNCALGKGS
jgi:hypothetical protein